jgi:hypothetical protein
VGIQEGEVRGMQLNFDSAYEIYVWEQWIFSRYGTTQSTLEVRHQMIVSLLNMIEKFGGKDMSSNIVVARRDQFLELPYWFK